MVLFILRSRSRLFARDVEDIPMIELEGDDGEQGAPHVDQLEDEATPHEDLDSHEVSLVDIPALNHIIDLAVDPLVNPASAVNPFDNPPAVNPFDNPVDNPSAVNPFDNPVDNPPAVNPFNNRAVNPVDNPPAVNRFDNRAVNPVDNPPAVDPFDSRAVNPVDNRAVDPVDNPAVNPAVNPVDNQVINPAVSRSGRPFKPNTAKDGSRIKILGLPKSTLKFKPSLINSKVFSCTGQYNFCSICKIEWHSEKDPAFLNTKGKVTIKENVKYRWLGCSGEVNSCKIWVRKKYTFLGA